MAHAAFQRELAVVGQRQITVAGFDESDQIVGQKRGGRAAAEIDGADFAVPVADFGFLCQLVDDFIGIGTAVIVFPGVAVEAAENAMVGAKRDIQVERYLPAKPFAPARAKAAATHRTARRCRPTQASVPAAREKHPVRLARC